MSDKKYPKTFHLPWSLGLTNDDKMLKDICCFAGKRVVVTEKMDGENTTHTKTICHARSLDSRYHPSRNWVKKFHGEIAGNIPDGWRVCGENVYAEHSIHYDNLESYFLAFSIWNDKNECLSWKDSVEWFDLIGVAHVPVIDVMEFDVDKLMLISKTMDFDKQEGYVIRLAESFHFDNFATSIAKFVRAGHVQTDEHWMDRKVIVNGLAGV